ncbi:MAG: topoisomerase C-terminal repeat-containing protein [Lachnospiraceae bacterium]|nr:topoisomerase C-terminal repeat-containing protein [Lachnospiraceae bacterium]
MKSIIITEKPSVAKAFAYALGVPSTTYSNGYYENESYIITWALGHLVTMSYPEKYDESLKVWSMDSLPFLPEKYKYEPISDDINKRQLNIIKELYHRNDIDTLYIAGDPAREGIYLQYLILDYVGINPNINQKVVWIDSQTNEEILNGIATAKDKSNYDNLAASGYLRAIEDYATGLNLSRAITIKYSNLLAQNLGQEKCTIAVGRVMSTVLGMVVSREREIRNFEEIPFYKLVLTGTNNVELEWKATKQSKYYESPLLYSENGFKNESDAQYLLNELTGKPAIVESAITREVKKFAPNLFNLAELQAECSKRFKMSPEQTLAIAQALYEKKFTSYPRTDARVLSSAIAKEIDKNIQGLTYITEIERFANKILSDDSYANIINSKYTDDSKISDHYAIIPTGQVSKIEELTQEQRAVYNLIVLRFLSIFMPPAKYLDVNICVKIAGENFFAKTKILQKKGFLELYNTKEETESELQKEILLLKSGDKFPVATIAIKEGKTSPPKRYSSGTLILAMENAGNLIEDEEERARIKSSGIGTSATRAAIISKLSNKHYIKINPKTQIVSSDAFGEMVYDVLNLTIKEVLSPSMTAKWELALDAVVEGKMSYEKYLSVLNAYVAKEIETVKGNDCSEQIRTAIIPFKTDNSDEKKLICPLCKRKLLRTQSGGYGCIGFRDKTNPCKFYIQGELCKKKLTTNQIAYALAHKDEPSKTAIKGFVSKSGKKFDARIKYTYNEEYKHHFELVFDKDLAFQNTSIACPKCHEKLQSNDAMLKCPKCSFTQYRKIFGRPCTNSELDQMLTTGRTNKLNGFYSKKSNKRYSARLIYDKNTDKISLDFY